MIADQHVLLTGGAGSVGQSLIPRILDREPTSLRVLDNNEPGLARLRTRFSDDRLQFLVGDVREGDGLERAMVGVDVAIHAAAMKHVDVCQSNPYEAVKTNVLGTQHVLDAAVDAGVSRLVLTSSDKAVNPANAMGTTKLLGEHLVSAGGVRGTDADLQVAAVRFGNVVNSSGSVVPRFVDQVRAGGPVELTDRRMTRFFLTFDDVFDLVTGALETARGGEVFVYKMPAIRIEDLADAVIETVAPRVGHDPSAIDVELIGRRPGETFHEEIMTAREVRRASETDSMYAIRPESATDRDREPPEGFVEAEGVVRTSEAAPKLSTPEIVRLLETAGFGPTTPASRPSVGQSVG